jgi:pilus assembly protein FimV
MLIVHDDMLRPPGNLLSRQLIRLQLCMNHSPPPIKSSALKTLTAAVASAPCWLSSAPTRRARQADRAVRARPAAARRNRVDGGVERRSLRPGRQAGVRRTPSAPRTSNSIRPCCRCVSRSSSATAASSCVTSPQPLNEPFVDMLLELSWNNGRLVREYTFLLDPAELRATQSAQVAAESPPPRATPRPQRRQRQPRRPAERRHAAATGAGAAPSRARRRATPGGERAARPVRSRASKYRVKPGDSLGRIAAQLKPVDVSLDMMLVALYRANPDAFIGNNMNRLKSGQILSVPDAAKRARRWRGRSARHRGRACGRLQRLPQQAGRPGRTSRAGQNARRRARARPARSRPRSRNARPPPTNPRTAAPVESRRPKGGAGKGATAAEDKVAKEKALADAQTASRNSKSNVNDLEKPDPRSRARPAPKRPRTPAPRRQHAMRRGPGRQAARTASRPQAKPRRSSRAAAAGRTEPGRHVMDNLKIPTSAPAPPLLLLALRPVQRRKKKDARRSPEPSILGVPTAGAVAVRRDRRPERRHQQQRVQLQLRAVGQPARHQRSRSGGRGRRLHRLWPRCPGRGHPQGSAAHPSGAAIRCA